MVRREACLWLLLTAASPQLWAQDGTETGSIDPADAAVYGRIERARRSAARFRLDGSDRDWKDVPRLADPRGDASGDPSRDVVAAAVAPTDTELWIMLRTAGKPSTEGWAFYVDVDLVGVNYYNFRLCLESLRNGPSLQLFDDQRRPTETVRLPGGRAVIRHVVEMRIPYRDIAAALPPQTAGQVQGESARPWVRIRPFTWNAVQQQQVDYGPAVAGFRLIRTPYPLDTPLPQRPARPAAVPLPVEGQWFVSQGAFGRFSHQSQWAYDLQVFDRNGHQSTPKQSKNNADHHAWGRPVFAPVDGRVLYVRSGMEDSPGGKLPDRRGGANMLCLDVGGGLRLSILHLQKGSIAVGIFDHLTTGQQVARVGNSGYSIAPHLHLDLRRRFVGRTVPMAFSKVRVGLNPVPDDPWARDLASWEPRYGYFVETQK